MIKKLICLLTVIITMSLASNGAMPKNMVPDFTKPAQQSREELKKLAEALAVGNSEEAARSAILYDALLAARDGDSLQAAIDTINSVASDKRVDAPVRALLNLYVANIYGDVYTQNRWVYDNRQQPLEPIPADCNLWNGEQFKHEILNYINKALAESLELKKAPMAEYGRVCGLQDKKDFVFYPTLYDFVAYRSIEILKSIQAGHFLFSFGLLTPHNVYVKEQFTYQSPLNKRILELYRSLIEFHHDDAAPMIWADVNRIKFITSHLSGFGKDEDPTAEGDDSYFDPSEPDVEPAPTPKAFRLLTDLYKQWQASPYSAEALVAAGDYIGFTTNTADIKYYCDLVNKQLAAYPSYQSNGCLSNRVAELTHRHVFIGMPSTITPGTTATIKITNYNAREFDLKVYKVPYPWNGDNHYRLKAGAQRTLVKTIRIKNQGTVPFRAESDTAITFDRLGAYIIVPTFTDGTENEMGNSYAYVHCSNLALHTMSYGSERWAMAVNPKTGAPVDKATVNRMTGNYRNRAVAEVYTTDSEGTVKLTDKGGQYYVKKGADTFASPIYSSWYSQYDKERVYRVCPLTDLAIYHPGDTVCWNIVSQSYLRGRARVEPSLKVRAILHNANYERIDTVEVTTDDWGRADGSFVLPKDGLTGQFGIEFRLLDQNKATRNVAGNVYFTVSDYKLPAYYIEVTDIVRDAPDKGGVTLKGRAMTYSGFPIASAAVDLNLKSTYRSPWNWRNRGNGGSSFYSTEVKTDEKGDFSIELPDALLKSSPVADPVFFAELTAVSSTGESQSTSASFTQGRPYIINSTLPKIINTSAPVNLAVGMADLSGKNMAADIRYVIRDRAKKEVASGVVSTANPVADLSGVPSGRYTFIFTPVDKALADKYVTTSHVLYKPSDKLCPLTDVALWVPEKTFTLAGTRHASILLGVTGAENHVHYAVYTDSILVKQGWVKYPAGMHRFEYDMPEGVDNVTLALSCTSDCRNNEESVKISLAEADKSIKLSVESFRDRLIPGDKETWTFRVTDASGRGLQAPVALDMYAKSLDNLATRRFSISPTFGQPMRYSIDMTDFRRLNEILSSSYRAKPCTVIGLPEFFISLPPFEGVGRGIRDYRGMVRGRSLAYTSAATTEMKMSKADVAEAEEVADMMLLVENNSASPAMGAVDDAGASEAGDESGDNGSDSFEYRLPETPLAFFRPTLTTDADGTLNYTFTVPNANTTWKLCAYTYNRDMEVADLTREAIASKPVMVQPNLPRFLRNGDRACVQSSVMNNTDSAQTIVSTVEIFNPASGKIVATETYEDSIAALSSAKISTWIDAPLDGNMIGYRVKSSNGLFTDGEQAIVPVLPSIEPVIETTPFYIPADAKEFSMKLPEMPKDARVTLQFCENPTWYVVTALPGIRDSKANDALSASAAIFSAAIADGILRTDTAIAEAIKMWNSSDKSDSTLVSMLQRNADLKTVLLSSTPWVMDAQSQTERMERLALLFDTENINSTYNEAVKKLSSLACEDGGWAWIGQYKQSSMWVTENILAMMGRLRQLGYMPDNKELHSMLDKAVGYYDAETEKIFRKDPKYTSPLFVLIRSYYPERKMSATIKNFISNTLGVESREWKRRGIPAKAIDAMILNGNNYPTVAKEIIASIRDFAVTKPERGMWWPSLDDMTAWSMGKISATSIVLDAFVNVVPGSADIDLIRQWLILQKEAKDWGTSVSTSDAVASILLSGSKWTRPAQGAVVRIGGKQVQTAVIDSLLGYFREDISQYKPSSVKLTVTKAGDTPSWGAVYAQYRDRMTDIKAASCPDLSIEKVLYRRVNSDEGVKWESVDELKVGDLVQVNLTVIANRDMDYVAIIDDRGACLEPVEQLPEPMYSEGICFYRENRDNATNMFITHLPKGTYRLSYEMYVNNAGTYSAGIASAQSQYAPALSAHSSGTTLTVKE